MTSQRRTSLGLRAISLLTVAFGLLTIREGGSILFGTEASRLAAGDYVPFVLWFNFIAGFAYLIAGVGLWLQRRWARRCLPSFIRRKPISSISARTLQPPPPSSSS